MLVAWTDKSNICSNACLIKIPGYVNCEANAWGGPQAFAVCGYRNALSMPMTRAADAMIRAIRKRSLL